MKGDEKLNIISGSKKKNNKAEEKKNEQSKTK